MAQIQVTVAEMEDKKAQLTQLNNVLKEEIENTQQIVEALKNEWEGDASDAFQQSFKQKIQRLMQAVEMIAKFIEVLGRIIEAYIQTEQSNTQIASK